MADEKSKRTSGEETGETGSRPGPQEPASLTQEQVDLLNAGGAKARTLRQKLLTAPRPQPPTTVDKKKKAAPAPLTQAEINAMLKPGRGADRVREKLKGAIAPQDPVKQIAKERPGKTPPKPSGT